jgi:hypothetical protein
MHRFRFERFGDDLDHISYRLVVPVIGIDAPWINSNDLTQIISARISKVVAIYCEHMGQPQYFTGSHTLGWTGYVTKAGLSATSPTLGSNSGSH